MILLNFGHPLTEAQLGSIQAETGTVDIDQQPVKTHFDHQRPFAAQVTALIDSLEIPPQTWQTEPFLINPPTLNVIAVTLLAELHGRMGYFPAVVRLKPVPNSTPPRFEFAEIINLQALRDQSRSRR